MGKQLRIGWFSFSCCEDSTIAFIEMMNEHYREWLELLDFCSARVLKGKNEITDLDVAFIEGAVATDLDAERVRKIRRNAKKVVAIGACAITGMPSAQRNEFDEDRRKEIQCLVEHFKMAKKVLPLHEVIPVDYNVPGCPMEEKKFLDTLEKLLREFGVKQA